MSFRAVEKRLSDLCSLITSFIFTILYYIQKLKKEEEEVALDQVNVYLIDFINRHASPSSGYIILPRSYLHLTRSIYGGHTTISSNTPFSIPQP